MNEFFTTPKQPDLIYDVGLHRGEDTEFYLKKTFRVIAFEADPDLAQFCRNRFAEFIAQGRLVIVEGAILDSDAIRAGQKRVQFYKNSDTSVWGTVRGDWSQRNARLGSSSTLIEIDAVDFAAVIQEHGVPHYMKIDIEGCDMVCIKALKQFQDRPDYVSLESSKTDFASIKQEIEALVDLGYDAFQAVEQSAIPIAQRPPNPAREGQYVAHHFEEGSSGLFGLELADPWKSKHTILRQYRAIARGYYLLGDGGVLNHWKFPGAGRIRWLVNRCLRLFTQNAVPGWYDTHARHRSVSAR